MSGSGENSLTAMSTETADVSWTAEQTAVSVMADNVNWTTEKAIADNVSRITEEAQTSLTTSYANWTTEGVKSPYVSLMNDVFSQNQIIALIASFAVFVIFGMISNAVTFLVINSMKKTPFNALIMSLCMSDFLSAVNSPLVVYRAFKAFDDYELPTVCCKLGLSIDFWTSTATIQHILAFSFLRLYCIKYPHNFSKITVKAAVITAVLIWVETFLVGFLVYVLWPGVTLLPGTVPPRFKCGMTKQWAPTIFRYAMVTFPILIYTPMILIILTCSAIGVILVQLRKNGQNMGQERSRKQKFAMIQLALIVLSFLMGYSVDVSYRVTAISSIQRGKPITARTEVIWSTASHFVLRLSECLNPIFYNFGSSELRAGTKKFLFGKCRWYSVPSSYDCRTRTTRMNSNPTITRLSIRPGSSPVPSE